MFSFSFHFINLLIIIKYWKYSSISFQNWLIIISFCLKRFSNLVLFDFLLGFISKEFIAIFILTNVNNLLSIFFLVEKNRT